MARCDYCDSYILFGGKQKSGRTFCNDECLQEGRLMIAADRLPQRAVDAAVEKTHQGDCPLCDGPGPVDVHASHTIWSIIALTSWRSTPNICCRSCGRQKQLSGLVTSGLFGWWGFPWGFIYTPIQIGKNVSGIFGGPDPEVPSEQLETLTRLELAIRVEAGEPLPGRRKSSAKRQSAPTDDRIPVECDDCGKHFKAKAAMAGKSGSCPGCGSRITVPEEDVWLDDDEVDDADDEWGGDSYGDSYDDYGDDDGYGDDWEQPEAPRRSSGSRRKSKPKKSVITPVRIVIVLAVLFVGLPIFAVIVGGIIGLFADRKPQPQFGQNNPVVIPDPVQPNVRPQRFPNQNVDGQLAPVDTQPSTTIEPADNPQVASNGPAATDVKPVPPLDNANPSGQLWVVLSNFREAKQQRFGSINRRWLIDYQVAAGTPSSNEKYVLHVSKSFGGGSFTQYSDVPVQLKTSGSIEFGISPALGIGKDFVATISIASGARQWKHVSGELAPDGPATATDRPPTIQELAGAAAQGKVVAIANAAFETGASPYATLTVDYALQQQIEIARYYMMVAETPDGQRFEFDVKFTLQRAKVGDEGKFNARLVGPVGQLKPPFTLHVEKRNSRFPNRLRPETPEVVSNKVNVAD